MGISGPKNGDTITTSSVTSMHDSIADTINAIPIDSIKNSTFGPQHLPSIAISGATDSISTITNEDVSNTFLMVEETKADVTGSNWKSYLGLDNSGAGYNDLPPCKVLVMFDATVSLILKDGSLPSAFNQAWLAITYGTTNPLETHFDPATMIGMVTGADGKGWMEYEEPDDEDDHDNWVAVSGNNMNHVQHHVSIWFVIDKTDVVGTWGLSHIQVRAACGWGDSHDGAAFVRDKPRYITLSKGQLSFVSFPKDS